MKEQYYFSQQNQTFYHSTVHDVLPTDAQAITEEQHTELLNALNSGCIVFADLTYSEPRPGDYYEYIDGDWVLNEEECNSAIINEQQAQKSQLLAEVKEEIEILQDTIDFDEHDEQDEAYLLELKKYRVQLNKVDASIIDCEFPKKPVKQPLQA